MKAKPLPSQERLKELLDYNPTTGVFTWTDALAPGRVKPGDVAGFTDKVGYIRIYIDRKDFPAGRVAWMWYYGEDPGDLEVDHIDRNPSNNSLENLRVVTHLENMSNRGIVSWGRGVSLRTNGRWMAYYSTTYLGTFSTEAEAIEARNNHIATLEIAS